jgi:hypothetical protein
MNVDEDVITNCRLVDYVYLTIRWIDIIFGSRLKLLWSVWHIIISAKKFYSILSKLLLKHCIEKGSEI